MVKEKGTKAPEKKSDVIEKNYGDVAASINSRLIEPVQVRHNNPSPCVLTIGRRGEKGSEKIFKGYQTATMKIQDIINIAGSTKLFSGEDGFGKNAALYVEDDEVRFYLGFDKVDSKGNIVLQEVLDNKGVLEILNNPKPKVFEEKIASFKENAVIIRLLKDVIKNTGFNDAKRVKYIENVLKINIEF